MQEVVDLIKEDKKGLSVFIVLDRSGSMSGERWTTSIESINEYIKNLQKDGIEGEVSLTAFDTFHDVKFGTKVRLEEVLDAQKISNFVPIDHTSLQPAGGTPPI